MYIDSRSVQHLLHLTFCRQRTSVDDVVYICCCWRLIYCSLSGFLHSPEELGYLWIGVGGIEADGSLVWGVVWRVKVTVRLEEANSAQGELETNERHARYLVVRCVHKGGTVHTTSHKYLKLPVTSSPCNVVFVVAELPHCGGSPCLARV